MAWFSGATYRRIVCFLPTRVCYTWGVTVKLPRSASGHSTGAVMPQNGMNYVGRRGGTRHNTWKASSQAPSTGWVNGAIVHNGYPAAATGTSETTPAGILNGTKPQCMVNGYINHGYKGKSTRAAPPRIPRKQGSMISAVDDDSAAGRGRSARTPGGISVKGPTSLDAVALPCNSDRTAPRPGGSTASRNPRRREKFKRKKRDTEVLWPEVAPPMLQQEAEDWEKETQEVTLTDWEENCFGVTPYGPQDAIPYSLRDLTPKQMDTVDLPVTANYTPAIHHPLPIKWSPYSIPTEPDQFADAEE